MALNNIAPVIDVLNHFLNFIFKKRPF